MDRYESLISQYKADLQRLDFISKGEQAVKGLPENGVCPFCGGELHPEDDDSYLEAINAEIKRIASELTVIAATENSVRDEQESIRKNIEELQVRRAEVNKALDDKNREIQNYRSGLQRFKDYTTLQTGIDFVNDQLAILGQKKVAELQKQKNPPLYHAKQEFEEEVGTGFNVLLNKILKECNYRNAGYASWDFSTFDILMDGVPKSEDQGKGYRSFLNSVVALMLYEYFNSDDVFIKPGFLMVDTPLLGFDENEDEFGNNTIKNGLYQYFINHQGNGQVNVKYLDSSKANAQVKKHLDALTIHKGYILVSDSGTLGRVTYALEQHDGHVATNNLIRIIVDDIPLRGYLYEFLQSELGQSLMLKNAYGTNQEHLEPDIIADIPIPIPKDKTVIQKIGNAVTESIEQLEKSISAGNIAKTTLNEILE